MRGAITNERGVSKCLILHKSASFTLLFTSPGARLSIAQRGNKEDSMQAVAPFVVMILVLAVIFYLAHWDANRGKIKR
jgi:hypothetical protein